MPDSELLPTLRYREEPSLSDWLSSEPEPSASASRLGPPASAAASSPTIVDTRLSSSLRWPAMDSCVCVCRCERQCGSGAGGTSQRLAGQHTDHEATRLAQTASRDGALPGYTPATSAAQYPAGWERHAASRAAAHNPFDTALALTRDSAAVPRMDQHTNESHLDAALALILVLALPLLIRAHEAVKATSQLHLQPCKNTS